MYKIPEELNIVYNYKICDEQHFISICKQNKHNILMYVKEGFAYKGMCAIVNKVSYISIRFLIEAGDFIDVWSILDSYKDMSVNTIELCYKRCKKTLYYYQILLSIAQNKNTPIYILDELISSHPSLLEAAVRNKTTR